MHNVALLSWLLVLVVFFPSVLLRGNALFKRYES